MRESLDVRPSNLPCSSRHRGAATCDAVRGCKGSCGSPGTSSEVRGFGRELRDGLEFPLKRDFNDVAKPHGANVAACLIFHHDAVV